MMEIRPLVRPARIVACSTFSKSAYKLKMDVGTNLTMFHKTYPIDLLAALKELAMNKNDNAIIAAIIENEAESSQLERVEQL